MNSHAVMGLPDWLQGQRECVKVSTLIVGIGSPHGDDQIGWAVVDRLRPRLCAGAAAHKSTGGTDLLELLEGKDRAILVDASAPSGDPGTVRRFDWPSAELEATSLLSSHGIGLVEILRLAEVLGRLPTHVTIYAVEAHEIMPGKALGWLARLSVNTVIESIEGQINSLINEEATP
jgi:hydrogenase maturation protease